MSFPDNIDALLAPRNIVLVGASDRNWSLRVHENLQRFAFGGPVFLVNPNRDRLWDKPCYRTLADLPETPDHLALFVPADQTLDILDDARGARSASLYAAGFGEGGDAHGLERAARLRDILSRTRIAAVGPNCMGLAVGRSHLSTIPDEQLSALKPGPVAVLTQSGMLAQTLSRGVESTGHSLAYLISCGNQIGLTFADYIDRLAEDDDLRVIACYAEAVPDAERFFAAAGKAKRNGKTIVLVKIGGSKAARQAALAHTGAMAGGHAAFDALAQEAGVVRVESLEDLVEAIALLARAPRPRGRRVAALTNSGAIKSLLSEAADAAGVVFPTLSETTQSKLLAAIPDATPASIYDTKKTISTDQYLAGVRALHDDPNVDAVLVAEELPRAAGIDRKINNLRALDRWIADEAVKPVAIFSPITLSESAYMQDIRAELINTPWLRDLSKSLRVIARSAMLDLPPLKPGSITAERRDALQRLQQTRTRSGSAEALSEATSKQLLTLYGVALPPEEVVTDIDQAERAASRIGYPVVLKAVSADVPHKSDAGLVLLGLNNAAAVRDAARTITSQCAAINAKLEGLLVARQMTGGIEMAAGIHRDPEMGPVVMVSLGGVWLEVFADSAFGPPGLDLARARAMIASVKASQLLDGYRGAPACDVEALANILVGLGQLALDFGDVLESVDVNPILVRPDGAYALDGLVVLGSNVTAREAAQ
jgi:acyl-CoA synthetase (NDP forming)